MKIISSELYVKDNKVYHEGNKPKPKDIGAAPETHTHNYASATTPGGSAEHAIKATEDSLGQRIDKYIKGLSVSGRTITYTRGDGTTGTITTQDTNTTYSVGTASALGLTKLYTGTGTATDGTMTQNAINTALNGKANSSHAHSSLTGTARSTIAPSTGTGVMRYDYNVSSADAGTLPNINNANGILTLNTHSGNYYNQLGFSSNGNLYYRAFNGVALDTTTAWKQVAFTNSSITGNAATATKLQTARTINGTSFDGTANITTANWGTARSLNGVSVNGSTNYTIPVENYYCNVGDNNTNLYHRILTTDIATTNWVDKSLIIVMHSGYHSGGFGIAKITFRTNDISSTANSQAEIKWLVRNGFAANALVFNFVNQAKNACMDVFYKSPDTYAGMTWYVLSEGGRGGAHSKQWTKYNTNASGTNAYTEANMKTLRTYTSTLVSATDAGHVSTANSASTLSTARTINGTNFNGSANITTANWGTARTITIGKTGKSVNGSGNVSWATSEILHQGTITTQDWNTANVEGIYEISNFSGSNSPTGAYKWGGLLTLRSGNVTNQVYLSHGNNEMWIRGGWNGSWNDSWSRVYTTSYKPSLSDIGAAASNHTHDYAPVGNGVQRWNSVIKCATWSRIMYLSGHNVIGHSGIINIQGTRGNVVFNATFIINTSHASKAYITQINNTNYSNFQIRAVTNNQSDTYVEVYDNANSATNATTQTLNVSYTAISGVGAGTLTKYTAFTDGTTIPTGFAEVHKITTVNGSHYSGNAATATKLQTARTINGTSFDGTANITTASWGTARNLQIGNTAKSVNGSANVSWSLSEIGAAPTSHNHTSLTGVTSIGFNSEGSDTASIRTTISGASTYLDMYLADDAGQDSFRWRFKPYSSDTSQVVERSLMELYPMSANQNSARLLVDGEVVATGASGLRVVNGNYGFFIRNDGSNTYFMFTNSGDQYGSFNSLRPICINNSNGLVTFGNGLSGSLSGNASTATKLQTARTIALGGILSGSASFDGSGNVIINATANDITTITKSLNVTTSWADTGITGSNLGTGTYAVQMHINDGTNTGHYNEYYSGIMSWYADGTNSTDADEILLHKAGHAPNGRHVYLRTIRTGNSGRLKLQISCTQAFSAASNITFKFKKLI